MIQSVEALAVILSLLPGFLALMLYESVAFVSKKNIFDRFVFALSITLISTVLYNLLSDASGLYELIDARGGNAGKITAIYIGRDLAWISAISLGIGIILAVFHNKDIPHKILIMLGVTRRTGAMDVWNLVMDVISTRSEPVWLQLRFKDGAILEGIAQYHSSQDVENKELFLALAVWYFPKRPDQAHLPVSGEYEQYEVLGPGVLVMSFNDLRSIEVLDLRDPGEK